LISAVTAFFVALVVVVVATPLVRRFALDVGAVDQPGGRRVHERIIPRLGGIAIVLACFAPLLLLFGIETDVARQFFSDPLRIVGLVAGGLIVSGLGVIVVVHGQRTSREALRSALRRLRSVGSHVLGGVLNDVDLSAGTYGYYQAGGYYMEEPDDPGGGKGGSPTAAQRPIADA